MIPIALGRGPGAAARASLAKVILGGQTLSLLLTLLVTPVAYSLWDDLGRLGSRLAARLRGTPKLADEPDLDDEGDDASARETIEDVA
jgi:hydrophobic/amphiphilic exporter-1 (mainly G- bacteria), HAE1 family